MATEISDLDPDGSHSQPEACASPLVTGPAVRGV